MIAWEKKKKKGKVDLAGILNFLLHFLNNNNNGFRIDDRGVRRASGSGAPPPREPDNFSYNFFLRALPIPCFLPARKRIALRTISRVRGHVSSLLPSPFLASTTRPYPSTNALCLPPSLGSSLPSLSSFFIILFPSTSVSLSLSLPPGSRRLFHYRRKSKLGGENAAKYRTARAKPRVYRVSRTTDHPFLPSSLHPSVWRHAASRMTFARDISGILLLFDKLLSFFFFKA